jgi:hypothetical protein
MSSLRQELAAILMDYTDKIPEQTYIDILNRLGNIPDHKDPMKAAEILKELNEERELRDMAEDEKDILLQDLEEEREYVSFLRSRLQIVSRVANMECKENLFSETVVELIDEDIPGYDDEYNDHPKWTCPNCMYARNIELDTCDICFSENTNYVELPEINTYNVTELNQILNKPDIEYIWNDCLLHKLMKNIILNKYDINSIFVKLLLHEHNGWIVPNQNIGCVSQKQMNRSIIISMQKMARLMDKSNIRNSPSHISVYSSVMV